MQEQKTNEQTEGQAISGQDTLLAIDIFKKAHELACMARIQFN